MFLCFADKMKDAIIAKVAAQAADFYKEANAAFQVSTVKQQLEKVSQRKNKSNLFSCLWQSRAC